MDVATTSFGAFAGAVVGNALSNIWAMASEHKTGARESTGKSMRMRKQDSNVTRAARKATETDDAIGNIKTTETTMIRQGVIRTVLE
jgi:hypothetical protein